MCHAKKSQLCNNPQFEFRRRRQPNEEPYIEGISDWCSECGALSFFFRSDIQRDPIQHLEEGQPKNLLASLMQDTAKGKRKPPDGAGHRSRQCDPRQEVHKPQRRDNMGEPMMTHVPRGSQPERQARSASAERLPRRHKISEFIHRRSRSLINEPRNRSKAYAKNLQMDCCTTHRAKEPDKTLIKRSPKKAEIGEDLGESHNYMGAEDSDSSYCATTRGNQTPFIKLQTDMANPWQEQVQQQVQQLLNGSPKSRKSGDARKCAPKKDASSECFASRRQIPLLKNQMAKELRELQDMEKMKMINTRLNEKLVQLSEWERISRRVDKESGRVRAELAELQHEKELQAENLKAEDVAERKRQRGGAHIMPLDRKSEQVQCTQVCTEKTIGDALDEKMEYMMETLIEHNQQLQTNERLEDEEEDDNEKRPDAQHLEPNVEVVQATAEIADETVDGHSIKIADSSAAIPRKFMGKLNVLVSTVQRARYCGFPEDPLQLMQQMHSPEQLKLRDPPLAQFVTVPCPRSELAELLLNKQEVLEPYHLHPLKVCRSPIYCPDADCRRMIFASDFNLHLTHGHASLAMERIRPLQVKTFFLDTRLCFRNKAKCHMVYFLRDKFIDNHTDKYPELLPILVMSARLRLADLFAASSELNISRKNYSTGPDGELFLIWLTSIRPDDLKLMGTLSVWPISSKPLMEYLYVQTAELYNIRSNQKLRSICKSNRVMMLPGSLVHRMTEGGKNLLAVQVQVY
ncbi:hypothetical protein KR222_002634 [Zaprionus bogoriensis]|nr:hypothetical protein KR222_002634 [Zaprionus bogoriensis]